MARRYQTRERQIIYDFLVDRDGEQCFVCPAKPPKFRLEIDHADGNPKNDDPDNLHLLCKMHNILMRQKTKRCHINYLKKYGAVRERERERTGISSSTHKVKNRIDFSVGSQEMKANNEYELQYREWLLNYLIQYKVISRKESANSGAEIVGCSQTTVGRYIDKLTSSVGPLKKTVNSEGVQIITFK